MTQQTPLKNFDKFLQKTKLQHISRIFKSNGINSVEDFIKFGDNLNVLSIENSGYLTKNEFGRLEECLKQFILSSKKNKNTQNTYIYIFFSFVCIKERIDKRK